MSKIQRILEKSKYFKLLDEENFNVIVKSCGRKCYEYIYGENPRWIRTGMIAYFDNDSNKFEKYEEVSEELALEYIKRDEAVLHDVYRYIQEEINKLKIKENALLSFMISQDAFDNLEQNIVCLYFSLGWDFYQKYNDILKINIPRVDNALKILFNHCKCESEDSLIQLRVHRNTRDIAIRLLEYYFENKNVTTEKYQILMDFFNQRIITLNKQHKSIIFS